MEIKIRPNVVIPDVPSAVNVGEDACLREVLLIVAPQLVDEVTGTIKDDPDIWGVRLNGENIHSLKEGLNTKLYEGDILAMELIMIAGG